MRSTNRAGLTVWASGLAFLVGGGCLEDGGDGGYADCSSDPLEGTWRTTYSEQSGSCGAIEDETVSMSTGQNDPQRAACTTHSSRRSPDGCTVELDETCPTTDGRGSQRWTIIMNRTSRTRFAGSGTVQVDHPLGLCRSTYGLTMYRL